MDGRTKVLRHRPLQKVRLRCGRKQTTRAPTHYPTWLRSVALTTRSISALL
ncbi:hypothetical protein T08_8137, partial [Trichinella sp. T8]